MKKTAQINYSYAAFALLLIFGLQLWWTDFKRPAAILYSDFEKLLDTHGIAEVWRCQLQRRS